MPSFLRKFIDLIAGEQEPEVAVHLAAFGKHPGWDDHIDDIGMTSERLAELKRTLYVEGIGGNIDSGAWDKLENEGRAIPFRHTLVFRQDSDVVVGRLWASRDGKGRSRYPMIIAAHCIGMTVERAMAEIMPRLARLQQDCISATTSALVRALVGRAAEELNSLAATAPLKHEPPADPAAALRQLSRCAEMGADGRGMLSVLYQIEREMDNFRRPDPNRTRESRTRIGIPSHPPQPLRVPVCGETPEQAAQLWLRALLCVLDPASPLLALLPADQHWLDVVVGAPTPSQLYYVRADATAMPLTTSIPYSMDTDFVDRATRMMAGEDGATSGTGAAPQPV